MLISSARGPATIQVGLVDERGWFERVTIAFVPHVTSGDAAERGVDHRNEPLERSFIPLTPRDKEVRNLSS
jgi:hypothetical protein